jgi:hypothetical protein
MQYEECGNGPINWANHVIDYTQEDFTETEKRYDHIFDTCVNHSLSACRRVSSPRGTYLIGRRTTTSVNAGHSGTCPKSVRVVTVREAEVLGVHCEIEQRGPEHHARPQATGRPVIAKRYRSSEVPEAIRYLKQGHARGKVVITFDRMDRSKHRAAPETALLASLRSRAVIAGFPRSLWRLGTMRDSVRFYEDLSV